MLTGEIWLDYDDGEDEEHWKGQVTRCIVRNDTIALEFSGKDPDYFAFQGTCNLRKHDAIYIGTGSIIVDGEQRTSSVTASFSKTVDGASLTGIWRDTDGSPAYELTIELNAS
jgi:hypothetical protein